MRCESGPIGFLSIIWARSEENSEGVGNTFVGVSSAPLGGGEETACYLVNGQTLIDTGWNAAANMQLDGAQPTDVDCVFFTHCRQDHTLGLPGGFFVNRVLDRCIRGLRTG